MKYDTEEGSGIQGENGVESYCMSYGRFNEGDPISSLQMMDYLTWRGNGSLGVVSKGDLRGTSV